MTRSRLSWWLQVTLWFALGRVLTTVLIWVILAQAGSPGIFDAWNELANFSSHWDGRWYNYIAAVGYPNPLPTDAQGNVIENAWAFLPVYPALVSGVSWVTTLPWTVAAELLSLVFAWGTALLLYRMLVRSVPAQQATFAVVLFSFAPVSPLYQFAYAESLQMLLIAAIIVLLQKRRYGWVIPLVILLAFTRPGAIAFALALGLLWIYRYAKRRHGGFPKAQRWGLGLAAVAAGLSGLAWMLIAGLVTGNMGAYLSTELAWRAAYIGRGELMPFMPWILSAKWWSTSFGYPELLGYVVLGILITLAVVFMFLPQVKRLGVVIRFWLLGYGLYILAVFFPQSSTMRILAPLFPALGAFAAPKSKIYRWAMVLIFVALQWWWLNACWKVDALDWTPP